MFIALLKNARFGSSLILRGTSPSHLVRVASTVPATTAAAPEKSIAELLKEELPQPYDGPERDHVNFPRKPRPVYPGKIRMGFLPDEWFQFFYKKTGVTGPYLFGAGLVTFLFSKELYIIEHEFSTAITTFILVYIAIKKFGRQTADFTDKLSQDRIDQLNAVKESSIKNLEGDIAEEKKYLWCLDGNKILMNAKRENVHMQLEAEYRKRQMHVYSEVKKRLDYQLDLANTQREFEQKHMVNWIVDNVLKGISPQQEKDALKKCIDDLKTLSVAH